MPKTPQKGRSKRVNQAKIRVFLSWSQSISKELASILKTWLPKILQNVIEPYFSDTDIEAGDEWLKNLHLNLSEADCGIFCITDENLSSVWMHYEAGAMIGKDYICPFLFGVSKKELISPLNNRQCLVWDVAEGDEKKNRDDFWKLVDRLSKICNNKGIEIDEDTLVFMFNSLYDQHIKPELEELGKRAQERKREAETKQAQADEIITEAYAKAKQITEDAEAKKEEYLKQAQRHLSQTREHYNQALSDVEVHSRTWSVRGFSVKNGNEPFSYKRSSLPDTLEIIMGQGSMPLPVSLGYLEHCLNILSAFPLSILRGHVEEGKDGKPDNGRWEVIKRGRALIDALHGKKQGCDKEQVTDFQRLVKAKLALPYEDDKIPYHNKQHGSPVSIQTVRRALETVIRNILLYLEQEKEESTW